MKKPLLTSAEMGARGGRSRSERKTAAARRNAQARRGKPSVVSVRKIEAYAAWLERGAHTAQNLAQDHRFAHDLKRIAADLRRIAARQDDEGDPWNWNITE